MSESEFDQNVIRASLKAFLAQPSLPLTKVGEFGDSDSFIENGILDSTGVLELVGHIENSFSIRIEAEEITPDNLDSIDKIVSFIVKKKAPGSR